ncbi:hypothetical protein [Hyphomonas sp.]|uniref:hypothetical protein n=1 Tax=Hyphomonas sp. TaxID=87 RepID=UPI003340DFB9
MTIRTRLARLEAALPVPNVQDGSAKQRLLDLLDQIGADGTPRLQTRKELLNDVDPPDFLDSRSPAEKLRAFLEGEAELTRRKDEPLKREENGKRAKG